MRMTGRSARLIQRLLALAALVFLPRVCAVASVPARVALPSHATVHEDTVRLSECLPASASDRIRELARAVVLGNAPQPGRQRVFDRVQILRELRGVPALSNVIEVPATISVSRWSRALAKEEVVRAVKKVLAENRVDSADAVSAEDIVLDVPVMVTEIAPRIDVTQMIRTDDSSTRVALWIASEPRMPPFWVTLHRAVNAPANVYLRRTPVTPTAVTSAAHLTISTSTASQQPGVRRPISTSQVLVQSGRPVQLIVTGRGMRISIMATALETGREGQTIRVESVPAGRILSATVIAAQKAEISY